MPSFWTFWENKTKLTEMLQSLCFSLFCFLRVLEVQPGDVRGWSQESGGSGQFILVLINKHYLKHLSGPVKHPPCGSAAPPTQGIEYLIIAQTE